MADSDDNFAKERAAKAAHAESQFGRYPPKDLPILYADSVINVARSNGSIKFYLARFDPSTNADLTSQGQLVAQVVMSSIGFAAAATLFADQLEQMIERNEVGRALVDEWRAFYAKGKALFEGTKGNA
jgi:hypothetical protein